MSNDLERAFPGLARGGYEITSPRDPSYNCIAWAAGETARWWWPTDQTYWPSSLPPHPTVEAFVKAFRCLGYERCGDASREAGWEKIAIYAKDGDTPTHAARQLPDGTWTSKLGRDVDIKHADPDAMRSNMYGDPIVIMRRESKGELSPGAPEPSVPGPIS